jgi:hypothetical protein
MSEEAKTAPRIEQVMDEINALFQQDAENIASAASGEPLTIVTGPNGNGKSNFLLPEVRRRLEAKGFDVAYQSIDKPGSPAQLTNRAPGGRGGVIILDEANMVYDEHDEHKRQVVLSAAHQLGWNVVAVIAYGFGQVSARDREIQRWMNGFEASHPQVFHLPTIRLDRDLARDFMGALREERHLPPMPPDITEFVLNSIPYSLRFLDRFSMRSPKTRREAIEEIKRQTQYLVDLQREEIIKINTAIAAYEKNPA